MDQYESMRILIVREVTDTVYSCIKVTASATMASHLHKKNKSITFQKNNEHQGHGIKEGQLNSVNLTNFTTIL